MKIIGLVVVSFVFIVSCKSRKNVKSESVDDKEVVLEIVEEKEETSVQTLMKSVLVDPNFAKDSLPSTVQIKNASVKENVLMLSIQYSGGCKDHDFDLMFTGNYMKSLPPKAELTLVHDGNDDMCRKLIMDNLYFSLKEIQTTGNELILLIDGVKYPISYKY